MKFLRTLGVVILSMLTGSCLDQRYSQGGSTSREETFSPRLEGESNDRIRFVNLISDSPRLNVFDESNGNRRIVERLAYLGVSDDIPYMSTNYDFRVEDSANNQLYYETTGFIGGEVNTMVFFRSMLALENIIITDSYYEGFEGESDIRFVHLSAGIGTVNVYVTDSQGNCQDLETRNPTFTGIYLRGVTWYESFNSGTYDICVTLRNQQGSNLLSPRKENELKFFANDVVLDSKTKATFFLTGRREVGLYRIYDNVKRSPQLISR